MNSSSCKYYTERTLGWMLNNKTIVFLSLLSFCLFVSTLAMAGQRNRLSTELTDLQNSLTSTQATTESQITTQKVEEEATTESQTTTQVVEEEATTEPDLITTPETLGSRDGQQDGDGQEDGEGQEGEGGDSETVPKKSLLKMLGYTA